LKSKLRKVYSEILDDFSIKILIHFMQLKAEDFETGGSKIPE